MVMVKRSAFRALLATCILTLAVASAAQAIVLHEDFQGIVAGWRPNGNPFLHDSTGDPFPALLNRDSCDQFRVDPGEIVLWFVQVGTDRHPISPNPGGTDANIIDVDLNDGEILFEDIEAMDVDAWRVDWFVAVDPPGDELELVSATSNVDGGALAVAGICIGLVAGATHPDTATASGAGSGSPDEAAWLLMVALGVFVASLVILTPKRTT